MRFGGMIFKKWNTPEEWAQAALEAGYSAVYFPVDYTADSYLRLIEAIDRKGFAAHLDPVNVICSPQLYYRNGEAIREWFDKLGTQIRSCHAKDIILGGKLTVHLDECRPGLGALDYETYLKSMSKLDDRTCMMLEHMTEEIDYIEATKYIKGLAKKLNIAL